MKTQRVYVCLAGRLLVLGAAISGAAAAMSVSLDASVPSPAPVGTVVTWQANVAGADAGTLWYRFRSRATGEDFHVIRDYGPASSLDWTESEHEGAYEVEVSVENTGTGEIATASAPFQAMSRVAADGTPAINPTAHPLVFLYSAPACPSGSTMRVQFQAPDGFLQSTPDKACVDGLSMNFYLAGLRPNSRYAVQHTVVAGGDSSDGPSLALDTPAVNLEFPSYTVLQPAGSLPDGILLHSTLMQMPVATDLQGDVVWFYPGSLSFLTQAEAGGAFLGILQDVSGDTSAQVVREFDLAGRTLRETNAAQINRQLAAMGEPPISSFHHEAIAAPDGKLLVLATLEQMLTDVQGPGPVDGLGDMIVALDRDLQVVWAWNSFDHLDAARLATLGETCTVGGGGCAPFYLAPEANDWLHGNSLQVTAGGDILYSSRHQDWLMKIDYENGQGGGAVLWRLGADGDFSPVSLDPQPWFSHQHSANFDPGDPTLLLVFDNGNVRAAADPNAQSRGQVWRLDEENRVALPILNADLGGYSLALGSAQKLPNGDFHFLLGWLPDRTSRSVELDSSGNLVYSLQSSVPEYRTFRMRDLYTP